MCGIAGFVQPSGDAGVAPSILARMTDRLRHRGPDGSGAWSGTFANWSIHLGHRRLSIIDVEGGAQPLSNEDGSVWTVYNGELYNFQSLRQRLESSGHRFRTRCDTETIVHHYEQGGAAGLSELNGMFAFAIWDANRGELLLARDRAGIKPLYYAATDDGGIIFASELTSLLQHPRTPRSLSFDGLESFFFLDYIQPPDTIIAGVEKLPPGHFLLWRDGAIRVEPYWQLGGSAEANSDQSEMTLADRLRALLTEAVESQLVSDVPVGVFLSGGIDSSLIATLAHQKSREPLQTFSIAFEDPQYDESAYARIVAGHLKTRHVEETLREADLLERLDDALDCLDEPMADPSIVPTYLLSSVAAKHVKVALGGDGGDELWAGYAPHKAYRAAPFYAAIPRVLRRQVIERAVARLPVRHGYQPLEWKAKRFALRWDDDPLLRHLRWMSNTDLETLERALPGAAAHVAKWSALTSGQSHRGLNAILALDFATYMPGSILAKVDRASMAHGLEVRPPFLDNRVIDFAFSLDENFKMRGRTSKYLLKRAACGLLPEAIIHRRKKGFGIPLAEWLRGPLRARVHRILDDSPLWGSRLLNRNAFAVWNTEHQEMRVDHAKTLWGLIVLDHWLRRHEVRMEGR